MDAGWLVVRVKAVLFLVEMFEMERHCRMGQDGDGEL